MQYNINIIHSETEALFNRVKRLFLTLFCFGLIFLFSACSLTGGSSSTTTIKKTASFLKSSDGGKNWENKIRIDDKTNIGAVDVLSLEADSSGGSIIYLGTDSNGLYATKDGAENWVKLVFPLTKIYGLAIDSSDNQIIYASGLLDKRGKIYKSTDGGANWGEIYAEPSDGSTISSLEISKKNPAVLYSGTSEGMIFKSSDGGRTWKNIFKASGPVVDISFDSQNDPIAYFAISGNSLLRTKNSGDSVEDLGKLTFDRVSQNRKSFEGKIYSVSADPKESGVVYAGTDKGLFRGTNFGDSWEEVKILESSKKFPIRAVAINPQNNREIIYSSAQVIYQSTDGGVNWYTFQLITDKSVQKIRYNIQNPSVIYAGLRKI